METDENTKHPPSHASHPTSLRIDNVFHIIELHSTWGLLADSGLTRSASICHQIIQSRLCKVILGTGNLFRMSKLHSRYESTPYVGANKKTYPTEGFLRDMPNVSRRRQMFQRSNQSLFSTFFFLLDELLEDFLENYV
jgi:hypothetical protein